MTMITPSYLGETIEYSSLHACRSTLEDPTHQSFAAGFIYRGFCAIHHGHFKTLFSRGNGGRQTSGASANNQNVRVWRQVFTLDPFCTGRLLGMWIRCTAAPRDARPLKLFHPQPLIKR